MRFSLRNASIWAFSALFGSLCLLGPGLHALVGEHWHGFAHTHFAHEHESHPCDHAADCRSLAGDHELEWIDGAASCDHDCPICEFFAQAQWSFDFQPALFEFASCEFVPLMVPGVSLALIGSYQSRAPPSGAAIG